MATRDVTNEACSRQLMRLVPMLMRVIRRSIKSDDPQLSVAHLRILEYLKAHPGSSLSDLSCGLEITNATASSHVEKLVQRQLVKRADHPTERRRIVLDVTAEGGARLESAIALGTAAFTEMLSQLNGKDVCKIEEGLHVLQSLIVDNRDAEVE